MTEPKDIHNVDPNFLTNREMISDMFVKVSKMHNVMYGDKQADIPGIAHRVKTLEDLDKKRTGIYIIISAVSAGISLGIKALADHFK
jgi:hypothetical protein